MKKNQLQTEILWHDFQALSWLMTDLCVHLLPHTLQIYKQYRLLILQKQTPHKLKNRLKFFLLF